MSEMGETLSVERNDRMSQSFQMVRGLAGTQEAMTLWSQWVMPYGDGAVDERVEAYRKVLNARDAARAAAQAIELAEAALKSVGL